MDAAIQFNAQFRLGVFDVVECALSGILQHTNSIYCSIEPRTRLHNRIQKVSDYGFSIVIGYHSVLSRYDIIRNIV